MLDKAGPMLFLSTVGEVDRIIAETKQTIKGAIASKDMPLDERWFVFCNIPEDLRDYKDYIQRLDKFEKKYCSDKRRGGFDWGNHFEHRGHRQSWVDFVEEWAASYMIEGDYSYDELGTTPSSLFTRPWEEFGLTAENLDELKEEILQAGYHGFVFDW